jgi:hypothetical protein
MRDQQFEKELQALDEALEKLSEAFDFNLVRLHPTPRERLQRRLARGMSTVVVILRVFLRCDIRQGPRG